MTLTPQGKQLCKLPMETLMQKQCPRQVAEAIHYPLAVFLCSPCHRTGVLQKWAQGESVGPSTGNKYVSSVGNEGPR